jgi:AraC-like DNA-binding protein
MPVQETEKHPEKAKNDKKTAPLPFGVPREAAIMEEEFLPDIDYLVHRKCTPVWQITENVFPEWDITYLTDGGARYVIDGAAYDLSAGDLLCVPPGHLRAAATFPDKLMNCFAVNFNLKKMEGGPVGLPFPLISHIGLHENLIHLFRELVFIWLDRPPLHVLKSRAMFMLILHCLFELAVYNGDASGGDFRIKKIIRHITSRYAGRISVKEMASMVSLNPVYLGALFKQETGMTMNRYLIKTRIRNAETLLRGGKYTVREVALRCGYHDVFHFSRQFKQICGFPPLDCVPKKNIF